jgi:hypothetical protein
MDHRGRGSAFRGLPDLLGLVGYTLVHDQGRLYQSAHSGSLKSVLQYVPMYWLHLFMDSYMHDPDRTWHGIYLRATLELLLWLMNIVLVVWFFRIWKRNASTVMTTQQ